MIIDYFKELILNNFGHNPTTQQQEVVEALAEFILPGADSDASAEKPTSSGRNADSTHSANSWQASSRHTDIFVLRGYAGTGKTSLVSALVRTMEQLDRRCVLMAPTGRAAKVFSLYASHEAFTIHKRIYRQKSIDDDTVFSMGYNTLKNALFIVDEASMISNDASNSIYGTGRLLDDLIQFVYSAPGCRLILMGDIAQLPPVGNIYSPALQPEVLRGYSLSVTCYTLTQVVRQHNLSGILQNATLLRGIIDQHDPSSRFQVQWQEDVYNMGIRNQILDREEELASGDLIMIVKNNYYWTSLLPNLGESEGASLSFIANGDIAQVLRVRNERELYGFRFADCELRFPDYDDLELTTTVLLDTLHTEAPALPHEQSEQLWNRVLEDYADIPTKKERMRKMKEDPYLNALQIKYAYAVTCHKAQGGQWSQVFIDQGYVTEDMMGTDYYRWLYTAFTRATEKVYLVNWPKEDSQD